MSKKRKNLERAPAEARVLADAFMARGAKFKKAVSSVAHLSVLFFVMQRVGGRSEDDAMDTLLKALCGMARFVRDGELDVLFDDDGYPTINAAQLKDYVFEEAA